MTDWTKRIRASVAAVPPLARKEDLSLAREENLRLVEHLLEGGVRTLLYGGNANFYHIGVTEYSTLLDFFGEAIPPDVWVIPSAGPGFGKMMDQGEILAQRGYETVMTLPSIFPVTKQGVEMGIRRFFEKWRIPVILYIKSETYLRVEQIASLMEDQVVSAIKYAVVRNQPSEDPFLRKLVSCVDPALILSGIGEQPAVTHMRDFGLGGFTSGCVCVAPRKSMAQLRALQTGEHVAAEAIRRRFEPLETLRNTHGPIPVLHEAVRLSGIAETGPLLPFMTNLEESHWEAVRQASRELLAFDQEA